ncbi:MAG TPA: head GIN domain-containing protein [Aquabacterium sp.]|nr:head GIN domain-containing protein [Aquabacterium sp.]
MARTDFLFRWADRVLGLGLAVALAGMALTALPRRAHAADAVVTAAGPVTSEARTTGDFRAITVSGGIDLKVRQGSQPAIEVRAEANVLPYLETALDNGTLQVRWKRGSRLRVKDTPQVSVTAVELQSISSAGNGDITVGALKTPKLALGLSGAGDIAIESIETEELSVSIAGSGDLSASGHATRLQVRIAGSGDVKTGELKADDVSVTIAGSGDASVHAAKTLTVNIAGSGDVLYRGDAQVKSSILGSGSVRKR